MLDINTCHAELKKILIEIDRICTECGVEYSLDGGTMLGAVREGGFIPWDDDADVFVLRENYDKFAKAMRDNLKPPYCFKEPQDTNGTFYDFASRVVNMDVLQKGAESYDEKYGYINNRICVDVFIYERFPDEKTARKTAFKNKVIYGMAMSKRMHRANDRHSILEKAQIGTLTTIGRLFSYDKIVNMWANNASKYRNAPRCAYRYCASAPLYGPYLEPLKEDYFAEVIFLPFEDLSLPVYAGYDGILTTFYGDYMQPPADLHDYVVHTDIEQLEQLLESRKQDGRR